MDELRFVIISQTTFGVSVIYHLSLEFPLPLQDPVLRAGGL